LPEALPGEHGGESVAVHPWRHYLTARTHGATFWTQDADFDGVEGVKYVARR
jgi:hypothetical protein